MTTAIDTRRTRPHLSRHERMALARTEAFSRRTAVRPSPEPTVALDGDELELIEELVRNGRTAVSSALLLVAGIGAGELKRAAVLAEVRRALAQADTKISPERRAQIGRHVERALQDRNDRIAA